MNTFPTEEIPSIQNEGDRRTIQTTLALFEREIHFSLKFHGVRSLFVCQAKGGVQVRAQLGDFSNSSKNSGIYSLLISSFAFRTGCLLGGIIEEFSLSSLLLLCLFAFKVIIVKLGVNLPNTVNEVSTK